MVVITDYVPFYRIGPQQSGGPDASLPADTIVRLIRKEFGYSYVQLDDGRFGYVASESLMPAPPRPAFTPENEGTSRGGGGSSSRPYSGPAVDDITLPDLNVSPDDIPPPVLLEDIEDGAKPEFRL